MPQKRLTKTELKRRARLKLGRSPSVFDYAMSTSQGREAFERDSREWQRTYHQRRNAMIALGKWQ